MGWGATYVRIQLRIFAEYFWRHFNLDTWQLKQDGGLESINLRYGVVDITPVTSTVSCGDYVTGTEFITSTMACVMASAAGTRNKPEILFSQRANASLLLGIQLHSFFPCPMCIIQLLDLLVCTTRAVPWYKIYRIPAIQQRSSRQSWESCPRPKVVTVLFLPFTLACPFSMRGYRTQPVHSQYVLNAVFFKIELRNSMPHSCQLL